MCPPSPIPLRALGPGCSEKDIVLHLDKLMCGSPVPDTVLNCVNPYQNQPQHLPPDIWYLVDSTGPKETEYGFWTVKGDACEIFENPVIKGWRTNLEFFKGSAPYGLKTEWVMQEYSITRKGAHKDIQKQSRVLCRVIKASGSFSNLVPSVVPNTTSTSGRGSSTESQTKSNTVSTRLPEVHRTESLFVESKSDYVSTDDFMELNDLEGDIRQSPEICRVEHPSDQDALYDGFLELADLDKDISKSPVVEKPESPLDVDFADTILRGDYLELNDLAEFASHSSSSANSSHRKSDDFFALLTHLDDEKSQDLQAKGLGFHCNYMGSGRSNEVILPPDTSELMITGTGTNEPQVQTRPTSSTEAKSSDKALKDPNVKRPKPEYRNEDSSNASTSRHRKKKFKKYFCCFPF